MTASTTFVPQPNTFQPAGPAPVINTPGTTNRGICSLSFGGKVFPFRTNPNEIWWDYELITKVDQTYGGRVIQILGTRLGDLSVKVDCGVGGWQYLMKVVGWLRDLLTDQRKGNTALFEYTTRNWKLHVYALSIPFQDEVEATVRELELKFKVQEDVTGIMSQQTLSVALSRLQDGVYRPDQNVHNQFDDTDKGTTPLGGLLSGAIPTNYVPSGITNPVNSQPLGDNPGGLSPAGGIPGGLGINDLGSFLPSLPGFG